MMELASFMWLGIVVFALVGALRGWTREVVATAGIVLALFASWQLSGVVIEPWIAGARNDQHFWVYAILLLIVTFFAYQTPRAARRLSEGRMWSNRYDGLQERILGLLIGGVNGYLVLGSLWHYMHVLGYPLSPYITAPIAGSASAQMISYLPLTYLVTNNLLTILVIVLFLFVIIAMV